MSLATEDSTRREAANMTSDEIRKAIEEIDRSPRWRGVEFDDVRVRHKMATRRRVLVEILNERESPVNTAEKVFEELRTVVRKYHELTDAIDDELAGIAEAIAHSNGLKKEGK